MKLEFKQAVSILGKAFTLGVHEVSEEVMNHDFIKKMIDTGLAKIVSKPVAPPKEEVVQKKSKKQKD